MDTSARKILANPHNVSKGQVLSKSECSTGTSAREILANQCNISKVKSPPNARARKSIRNTNNNNNNNKKSWINGDFEKTTKFEKRTKDYAYSCFSLTELFELFFTDDVWDHIQTETTKYALSLKCPDPQITKSEIKCFFGILIVSSRREKVFLGLWCGNDMRNEFVSNLMRRERFIAIMPFMHWADNSRMSTDDKVWKIRPVIDMLQAKFLENFVPTEHLNYDESMIKYFGRHGLRQFIKSKPIDPIRFWL